jgi:hypothetical protein
MTAEEQWQHMWELQQLPRTPGTAGGMRGGPMTPRTTAFADLEGGSHRAKAGWGAPGGWNGGGGGGAGAGVGFHAVSPVQEQDEFSHYPHDGRGKGTAY